jgi:hypothetical protein
VRAEGGRLGQEKSTIDPNNSPSPKSVAEGIGGEDDSVRGSHERGGRQHSSWKDKEAIMRHWVRWVGVSCGAVLLMGSCVLGNEDELTRSQDDVVGQTSAADESAPAVDSAEGEFAEGAEEVLFLDEGVFDDAEPSSPFAEGEVGTDSEGNPIMARERRCDWRDRWHCWRGHRDWEWRGRCCRRVRRCDRRDNYHCRRGHRGWEWRDGCCEYRGRGRH